MKYENLTASKTLTTRERVLVAGAPGTKKSSSILEIALMYPDIGVAIIDTDDGLPKLISAQYGGWDNFPNIRYYPTTDWPTFKNAYDDIRDAMEPGDWLAIDMIGEVRRWAVNNLMEKKYGMSKLEYKLEKAESRKTVAFGGLEGSDWDTIDLMLRDTTYHSTRLSTRCNLLFTCGVKPVYMKKEDGKEVPMERGIPDAWVEAGVRPDCEWALVHKMDTILLVKSKERTSGIEFAFQTISKDRNTSKVSKGSFVNLWQAYCESNQRDFTKSPGK